MCNVANGHYVLLMWPSCPKGCRRPLCIFVTAHKRAWTIGGRLRLKCDGARAETRFRLSAKRASPFKSAAAAVQSTTGSRGVRISGSNAGCAMFRGSVKGTGYPLHSPVSLSLPPTRASPCSITFQLDSNGLRDVEWEVDSYWMNWKNSEGSVRGNQGGDPGFAWRDCQKPRNIPVTVVADPVAI